MIEGAASSQAMGLVDMLREGIAAAKAGQRERARTLLMRVVDLDERNATAWLWLSGVVDSLDDREICMENVLAIDPNNAFALRGLELVRREKASRAAPPEVVPPFTTAFDTEVEPPSSAAVAEAYMEGSILPGAALAGDTFVYETPSESELEPVSEEVVPESPVVARTRTPVSPASAMLRENFASQLPALEPEPGPPPAPIQDEFADEYLCPYCASPTEPDDRRCKACGGNLWVQFRKQQKHSKLLWTLIAFQAFNTLVLAILPLLIYWTGPSFLNTRSLSMLMHEEIPAALPSGLVTVLALAAAILFLFSLVLLVGLYLRWKLVYYLLLAQAGIELLIALVSFGLVEGIGTGLFVIGMALVTVVLTLQLGSDFEVEKRRILLRVDRGLKSGPDYLARANHYSKQEMWALSALHLRTAAGLMTHQMDVQAMLATMYIRLGQYDRAERVVAEAERIAPADHRVRGLKALLEELRAGGSLS